jgi:hypothetical protein
MKTKTSSTLTSTNHLKAQSFRNKEMLNIPKIRLTFTHNLDILTAEMEPICRVVTTELQPKQIHMEEVRTRLLQVTTNMVMLNNPMESKFQSLNLEIINRAILLLMLEHRNCPNSTQEMDLSTKLTNHQLTIS